MAYSFGNGVTDRINCGTAMSVSAVNRTLYIRLRPNLVGTGLRGLFHVTHNGGFQFPVWAKIDGASHTLAFGTSTGDSGGFPTAYPGATWNVDWSPGTEHVFIGTYDGSNLRIYTDTDASAKATLAETGTPNTAYNDIQIGNEYSFGQTHSADGIIYEVAYWDGVVLSEAERLMLGKGFSPLFLPNKPTAYWDLVADAADRVGNNNGTVTGATVTSHTTIQYPQSGYSEPVPSTPTVTFIHDGGDSFGNTNVQFFNEVVNTTAQNSVAITGGYSLLCESSGAGVSGYVGHYSYGAARRWSVRYRFRDLPASHEVFWLAPDAGFASPWVFGLAKDSSHNLRLMAVSSTPANYVGAVGPTLTTGVTYRISVAHIVTSITNWNIRVWVDGVLVISASQDDLSLTHVPVLSYWGYFTSHGGSGAFNQGLYLDDIYIDSFPSLTDPGDIVVTNKRPAAAGTSGFDTGIGSGTNRWDRVSEVPYSETNGWREATPATVQLGNTAAATAGNSRSLSGGNVRAVKFTTNALGGEVHSIAAYLNRTAGGGAGSFEYRFGIYTDSGGNPNTLVANSSILGASGLTQNSLTRYSATYGTRPTLTANTTYWLAVQVEGNSLTYDDADASYDLKSAADAFADGLAATFSGSPTTTAGRRMNADVTMLSDVGAIESYQVQGLAAGEEDISGYTVLAQQPWIAAKASASGNASIFYNDTELGGVALTTSTSVTSLVVNTSSAPAGTNQIGIRAVLGNTDTDLYECGIIIAARAPGAQPVTGTAAVTLSPVTESATGTETITGTAAAALNAPTTAASGTETFTGTSAVSLSASTVAASGTVVAVIIAGAIALNAPTVAASGALTFTGTAAPSLPSAATAASGAVANPVTGTTAVVLSTPTVAALGEEVAGGTVASTLPVVTTSASGTVLNPISGSAAVALPSPTAVASGAETISGAAPVSLAASQATATGTVAVAVTGTATVVLSAAQVTATGHSEAPRDQTTIAATLSPPPERRGVVLSPPRLTRRSSL